MINGQHKYYDLVQRISAVEVARRIGMQISKKGSHWWMICPLHKEKTASFCFYDNGGWYCFGCKRGGNDGISFYGALFNVSYSDAANKFVVQNSSHTGPAYNKSSQMARKLLLNWRDDQMRKLKSAYNRADMVASFFHDESAWDEATFVYALCARSAASARISELESANMTQLISLYEEENNGTNSH